MKNTTPTPSRPAKKQPYIVREIDSRMLRKHPDLSKGARELWATMLSMADARTGELRHRDHWYSGIEIDMRAELSHVTRKLFMKELALAGYVRWERERIRRLLRDRLTGRLRMRSVSGRTKYFVFKSPHKDWFSHKAAQKSPRKHWRSSKVRFSQTLESRNTPNKSGGPNGKSPHKQRLSSKVKSLYDTRTLPASLSVNHQEAGFDVSGVVPQDQFGHFPSSSVSGIHLSPQSDDDEVSPANPKKGSAETPELRIQRFKESAASQIKTKYGDRFSDLFVRECLDEFESRIPNSQAAPNSPNYFSKCFENEFANVSPESVIENERIPNPSATSPPVNATHDELLKDTVNYGRLQWGGHYIVVHIGGYRGEIISRDTAQAMTGSSSEHMAEHLRSKGFWAEVYTQTDAQAGKPET